MTERPANLTSIPSLTHLEVQLRYNIQPSRLPEFVDLDGLQNLQTFFLSGTLVFVFVFLLRFGKAFGFQGFGFLFRGFERFTLVFRQRGFFFRHR